MTTCLFVSDLHGRIGRYEKLFREIEARRPAAVFLGGDLLPPAFSRSPDGSPDFSHGYLGRRLTDLRLKMGIRYPAVFAIAGNDDPRSEEPDFIELDQLGLWRYVHDRSIRFRSFEVFGYAFVPPTPFQLKDWERYDVSRYVPPGSVSPEEGRRTLGIAPNLVKYSTILDDLARLAGKRSMDRAIVLFHAPPHETSLDRAALDGRLVDGVPVDVHVGSIAIRRFIESRQPLVTLHGHIHESARLTGSWRDRVGRTHLFSAAHDGPELALVQFDLDDLEHATRELL